MAAIPCRRRKRGLVGLPPGTTKPTKIPSTTPLVPSPRVGTTTTSLHGNIYLFPGGGGAIMTSSFWVFEPSMKSWNLLSPADITKPYLQTRGCRTMINDGGKTIYVHAGSPAQGQSIDSREQPRGGISIAFSQGYYPYALLIIGIGDDGYTHCIRRFDSGQKLV